MSKVTEALKRLRALADGPKGGRADYVGTLSSADAHLLSVQLSQLLKLKACVDDALPALHWVIGHMRAEAENCRRHRDFSPIASTFDDASNEIHAVVLANIGADFTASLAPLSEPITTSQPAPSSSQTRSSAEPTSEPDHVAAMQWTCPDCYHHVSDCQCAPVAPPPETETPRP